MWGNEREKECFCEEEMGEKRVVWLLFLLLSFAAAAAAFALLQQKGGERERKVLRSLDEEREGITK